MKPCRSLAVWFGRCTLARFGSVRRTLATLFVTAFVLQFAAACVPVLTWRAAAGYPQPVEFTLHGMEFHGGYWRGYYRTDFWWTPAANVPFDSLRSWAKYYPGEVVPPRWSRVHDPELVRQHLVGSFQHEVTEIDAALGVRHEIATGLPFRALACMLVSERGDAGALPEDRRCVGGYRLPSFRVQLVDDRVIVVERVVPLRPLPLGIALNTLVFWLTLLLIAWVWVRVRALTRFEHGCCPRCGGDLGFAFGAGCPGCHWRPRAAGSAHG